MAIAIRAAIDAMPPLITPELDLPAYGEQLADLFDRATRKETG